MSNPANSDAAETGDRHQQATEKLTRRQVVIGGAAISGLTTAVMTGNAQANTQIPPEPASAINPDGRFAGKVVLITGATSGIGEGTAYAFAKEGAKVFFCGRRENLGNQVAARIKEFGGEATYMQADVKREEGVEAFVDSCV